MWLSLQCTLFNNFQNYVNFGLNFELEKRYDLFPSTQSAELSNRLYVMDIYSFMPLAVAITHHHLVKKVRSRFLQPGKIVQK